MFLKLLSRPFNALPRCVSAPQFPSIYPSIPSITSTSNSLQNIIIKRFAAAGGSPFMPKRRKFKKAQKGRVTVALGTSHRGGELAFGDYGVRSLEPHRLTARQLDSVRNTIRRVLKPTKGLKMYMRVFPDIPVTSKGTEVRMGKGKGAVEYWATRVRPGKILFEFKADLGLTEELAKEAVKAGQYKLPIRSEFVVKEPLQPPELAPPPETELLQEPVIRTHSKRKPRLPSFVRKYNLPVPTSLKEKGYSSETLLPDPRTTAHTQ
jgi:ribosomal protein L16